MANPEHFAKLKEGVVTWNAWREENDAIKPDLSNADLSYTDFRLANLSNANLIKANLIKANFIKANLCKVNLSKAKLIMANLEEANLHEAKLSHSNLSYANLIKANLEEANLHEAKLSHSNLSYANLIKANLEKAILHEANLSDANLIHSNLTGTDFSLVNLAEANLTGANFTHMDLFRTSFTMVDLSNVKGLETCFHHGQSSLDTHTLTISKNLPEIFLRGCGLSNKQIQYLPSVFSDEAFQYYSCFISYSTKDQAFAERLYNDLQGAGVRCWFAPEDIQGGKKLVNQIDSAIRLHDKLLLIISSNSMNSKWVKTELKRTLKLESQQGKRKLFPLGLADMKSIQDWECFDATAGEDLADKVREYFIPDFNNWETNVAYQKALKRLLKDLKEGTSQKKKRLNKSMCGHCTQTAMGIQEGKGLAALETPRPLRSSNPRGRYAELVNPFTNAMMKFRTKKSLRHHPKDRLPSNGEDEDMIVILANNSLR